MKRGRPPGAGETPPSPGGWLDRRLFLGRGLHFAPVLAAAAGGSARAEAPGRRLPGQAFTRYGQPSPHEAQVLRSIGLNVAGQVGNGAAWTPLERLEGSLTPNGLHFVRNHHGTPDIDPARHRLVLHGCVDRPLSFSVEALLRYPQQTRKLVIECGGNSSAGWFEAPVQRTVGLTHGLVSCAEWTGVPVALLLDECGVRAGRRGLAGGRPGAVHHAVQRLPRPRRQRCPLPPYFKACHAASIC